MPTRLHVTTAQPGHAKQNSDCRYGTRNHNMQSTSSTNASTCETYLPENLRLYSVQQVAKILQVRESAVRKLIYEKKLAAVRVGVLIRVSQIALEEFLEENPCTEPDARRVSRGK